MRTLIPETRALDAGARVSGAGFRVSVPENSPFVQALLLSFTAHQILRKKLILEGFQIHYENRTWESDSWLEIAFQLGRYCLV